MRAMSSRAPWSWRLASFGSRRRFAWVFALALLLPLAQAVATAHTITHHAAVASHNESNPSALVDAPCALCLGAASLAAGALPSAQAALPAPLAQQRTPAAPAAVESPSAIALGYQSRAPPPSLI
jgi:hypothetical protein